MYYFQRYVDFKKIFEHYATKENGQGNNVTNKRKQKEGKKSIKEKNYNIDYS